ncbi:NodT family efflux transporter outer membrane factor (OMF) lipoprotein [Sphingobium xenophagum]|uniref:NodT family efflux transporter outer membrane factor (OMF) lipoprotein n=1 Tax=Sphingobium xenophagum TaxID=121428 RepID=A0ABU1X2B5_SPHXE|nr:efflux transporter outer membrane subunit [Sphingobium xenophagum]MDR7155311.1 NodT family efflux transporter outer membrane factor (OMF) lipoprotein [Sphingobium xenophagum]
MRYRFAGICGTALSLSACAVGPDYRPPQATLMGVPATYYQNVGTAQNEADLALWWTRLNDPTLSALIDTAIANNLDIVQAQARLRQARESLAQSNAAFLPQLNASGNGGKNYRSQAGGTRVDDSGNVISTGESNWSSSYSANTSASWQIDLFGRLSRTAEAARAELAASGYDLATVRLTIISELVTNYVQARLAQEQLRIARETQNVQQDNFDIAGWRLQAGLVSSLDEQQARAQLAQTRASIPQQEANLRGSLNRIAVLTGQAPGEATRTLEIPAPIPTAASQIALGIPADTLRQRPDVRSAERSLAAATARIGVAQAQLYPSLGISGNLATTSNAFSDLFSLITGGVFANVSQVIFDGGRLASQVRSQRAATDAAFAAYKQSVLTALEDVENAMASLASARTRQAEFATAYDASNNAALLARSQYQAGLIDFQTLSNTETTLLNARNSLANARSDEILAIARLYDALGGGWQSMDNRPDEQ